MYPPHIHISASTSSKKDERSRKRPSWAPLPKGFNGSGKGHRPAGTIGNRTHILSEWLKTDTEFKRLKKGHRPAPMPPMLTHILSYKPGSLD